MESREILRLSRLRTLVFRIDSVSIFGDFKMNKIANFRPFTAKDVSNLHDTNDFLALKTKIGRVLPQTCCQLSFLAH